MATEYACKFSESYFNWLESHRNIAPIWRTDRMESLNFGDERPVNIMDCRKYGRLLGCLL